MTTRLLLGSVLAVAVTLFAGDAAQADPHRGHSHGGHRHGGGYHGGHSHGGGYYGGGYSGYYGGYGRPSYGYGYSRPHVDHYPGRVIPHYDHYHYVPPHSDLHIGGRRYEIDPWTGYVSPFPHRP